jgi:AcrR family transcriptional regulator
MSISPSPQGSTRQASADRTRLAILKAARQVFAGKGYAEAGVRDIAAEAGANPALIARYYGSKLALFEAALEASLDASVFTGVGKAAFGATLAGQLCAPDNQEAANPLPMILFAASDPAAREVALSLLTRRIIAPLETWFGKKDAKERAAQFLAIATGFLAYRMMLPLTPMQDKVSPAMRGWLARSLQEIVDRP